MPINPPFNRKLRMGLVGGGRGAFIGRVHVTAALLDQRAELVAGAFASDPGRSRDSAEDYGVSPARAYGTFQEMAEAEARLPESERIDFVTIATPNDTHFVIASTFARAGFNIICEKPLTYDLAQAVELARVVQQADIVFALMHNYTGYPLVRQARDMVRSEELGTIQAIRTTYLQGWLRTRSELDQQKQALWRTDPARAGAAGCFGDIGSHAYHLGRFITGLVPASLSCQLRTFEEGRRLDDYGLAVIHYHGGALGVVAASQIAHGRENDLWIEIDGTRGSLEWHQENPNRLVHRVNGQPKRIYTRDPNASFLTPGSRSACRLPSGHPEGFFEAFANVYDAAFDDMVARAIGQAGLCDAALYPGIRDGVEGMEFLTQCVASSGGGGTWVPLGQQLV